MDGKPIDPKALEDAVLKALPSLFSNLSGTASNNPRVEFYDKFGREAEEHDRGFTEKYDDDLDTTLIFAGLFSAVATGFIVDVQQHIQPDYQQMGYTVLEIIANSSLGRISASDAPEFPRWDGPDPATAHVLAILYSSLASSLLAAFIAMLGKQWLNRYGQTETHGSAMDRSRDRQRKIKGMANWRFALVMECLPLMLQAALLLLGYALSQYLLSIDKTVAGVAIGFTSFGLLFYFLIVAAATFSYNCPFQTPLSLIFHFLVRYDDEHKKYLKNIRDSFGCPWKKKQPRPERGGSVDLNQRLAPLDRSGINDHIGVPIAITSDGLLPFFDKAEEGGYVLDSKCIAWMFEKSTDADAIMAIMRFIPEVYWHSDIRTTPLERLYDTVVECFDRSSGHPVVSSKLKTKAYVSARALLHVAIQRKCIDNGSDKDAFKAISDRYQIMGSGHYQGDSDLESTLGIIDRIFGGDRFKRIPWQDFSFEASHHVWMGHVLLFRAWNVNGRGQPLPDDVKGFVLWSLQSESPPPATVMDCLSIIGLILKIELHIDDSPVIDLSRNRQINVIYEKLTETFNNLTPTADEIDCALEAMELIAPLSDRDAAQKSYNLFRVVMQAPTSNIYTEERKWEAIRLTIRGAYKSGEFPVRRGEPLSDSVKEFVLCSLQSESPPPGTVMDCLSIIGLVLKLYIDDSSVIGMSRKVSRQINVIYEKLTETFKNLTPTADEIDCALKAMELIAPLSDRDAAQNNYNLFRVVMQAPNSGTYTEERKWEAIRLTIRGAYKSGEFPVRRGEPLPDGVKEFVLCSLQSKSPPPGTVMDCLSIIGLVLKLYIDDSSVIGMSRNVNPQINAIYEKLTETFKNLTPTADEIDCALKAMELIAPLSDRDAAQKSYNLFCVVMQAPTSDTYTEEMKWEAARLTMHGAYKSDEFLPPVEDPQDILAFLTHHFDLTVKGSQCQDVSIQDALRALAHPSGPAAVESLKRFDPMQPRGFVDGIRCAYRNDKQPQLRKAAFFFLPLISDKWFNTPRPIMKPDEMKSFCVDWASTMDSIKDTDDVKNAGLTVLFGMINSPHWRSHIVTEKLGLLEYFALVPGNSQPLKKCMDNPELIDGIKDVAAAALWLKILWLKHGELKPEVKRQLETFTKGLAQGRRRPDLEGCYSAVDSELKMAEEELTRHSTTSQNPIAVALRAKVENLRRAHTTLANIKSG